MPSLADMTGRSGAKRIAHDNSPRPILATEYSTCSAGAPPADRTRRSATGRATPSAFALMAIAAGGTAVTAYLIGTMINEAYVNDNFQRHRASSAWSRWCIFVVKALPPTAPP